MTATGTSSPASLIVPTPLAGVAPSSSARREASWITGPSITGSENGIPTSIASAPATSSPRSSSASTPLSPPVTYGTKTRPPAFSRERRDGSRSGTRRPHVSRHRPERTSHRLEVLVAPAGQVDEHERTLRERAPEQPSDRVGGFEGGQDAFGGRGRTEPLGRLVVGDRDVGGAAHVLQERVLGAHARVVQPRRDRMRRHHLPLLVLQKVGVRPVQHARLAERERPAVLPEPIAPASGLHADEPDARFGEERLEDPDRVAAPADPRDHHARGM